MSSTTDSAISEAGERFHEGKQNSHLALDSSKIGGIPESLETHTLIIQIEDERSIANKLAREQQREHEPVEMSKEEKAAKQDATLPAKMHGNKPSHGAVVDQQLREEEEAELKRKGKA
ncbi:hypothetical protein DSL72_005849 [Monilinia vaccinii-corymbosi]|uniref:Uncharacterized protein n=1 Tax=Monilinia vaccinii-corymbosi TaxID=61207 RepID=A0A8A3PGU4_9HELO|nr:hypothetical protein DSL72_005849 [Monilinia vaccinii-corymbosi]